MTVLSLVQIESEIEMDKLWAMEKVLDIHTTRQCPSVYTAKLSYALNLDFHHETRIGRICQRLYGLAHHKPTNLFAAVVKLYCKANNIKLIFSEFYNHCSILLLQQLINLTLFTDVSPREQLALVHAFQLPTPYVIVKECINVSIADLDSTEHGIDT